MITDTQYRLLHGLLDTFCDALSSFLSQNCSRPTRLKDHARWTTITCDIEILPQTRTCTAASLDVGFLDGRNIIFIYTVCTVYSR